MEGDFVRRMSLNPVHQQSVHRQFNHRFRLLSLSPFHTHTLSRTRSLPLSIALIQFQGDTRSKEPVAPSSAAQASVMQAQPPSNPRAVGQVSEKTRRQPLFPTQLTCKLQNQSIQSGKLPPLLLLVLQPLPLPPTMSMPIQALRHPESGRCSYDTCFNSHAIRNAILTSQGLAHDHLRGLWWLLAL